MIRILEITNYPIIMTCNDLWQTKLSSLRSKCKLVEMKALNFQEILDLLKKVSEKEGIKTTPEFLKQISIKSQGDVRAALNDLQSYSRG